MTKVFAAAVLVAVCATAAISQTIPDGEYTGLADGSRLTMMISGDNAKLMTVSQGCSGQGEGPISQIAEGRYQIKFADGGPCTIDVTAMDGSYLLEPQYGAQCWEYSGQSCGFDGNVTQ